MAEAEDRVGKSSKSRDVHNTFPENISKTAVEEFIESAKDFKEEYDIIRKIGEGSYGTIYSANWKYDNKAFPGSIALKILHGSRSELNEIKYNVTLCTNGICKHIVCFFGPRFFHFDKKEYYVLQMEYCTGGTLYESVYKTKYADPFFQLKLLEGLIKGLSYIHSFNLVHHDIHEWNIVFRSENDATVKFGDFGLTKEDSSFNKVDDIKALANTLIRVVFARKEKPQGSEKPHELKQLLMKNEVQKNIADVLVGLYGELMNLETALSKIKETRKRERKGCSDALEKQLSELHIESTFTKYDGIILNSKKDKEKVKLLIEEANLKEFKLVMFDDFGNPAKTHFRNVESMLSGSHFILIFVTENFAQNDLERYNTEVALLESLRNPNLKIIPVWGESGADSLLFQLNHLTGFRCYGNDINYGSLAKVFRDRRKKNE